MKNKRGMYDKDKINKFANEYIETSDEEIFTELLNELDGMISVQLGKNYGNMKEYWSDMKQDILLILWRNRENVKTSRLKDKCNYYYGVIREGLSRATLKLRKTYDALNPKIKTFEELTSKERKEAKIQPLEEEWEKHED